MPVYVHVHTLLKSSQFLKTALHYASEGGHHDTVRVLLERGAEPNARDKVTNVWVCIMLLGVQYIHMYTMYIFLSSSSCPYWCISALPQCTHVHVHIAFVIRIVL